MELQDVIVGLRHLAQKDPAVRDRLLATQQYDNAQEKFCALATELGFPLSATELAFAGEDDYAHMRRATNGGGESSPVLEGEDDYYDLFMSELNAMKYADA
ncbi:MAG: hypothetical protein Q4C56_01125 [Peptococcaceae bacterium]|nr:hypothetical protein [Peptococcaceae bacterium]